MNEDGGVAAVLAPIAATLDAHGLALRGGFDAGPGEELSLAMAGVPGRSVVLVGTVGDAFWPHFAAWWARNDVADPMDEWTREVVGAVADRFEASLVLPNERPFQPFQRWAMRAEGLKPSPLGLLVHPEYGLWHAYRAALLFSRPLGLSPAAAARHPCDACRDKPCLAACPVEAHSAAGFQVARCRGFAGGEEGATCRSAGCQSRNACPVGAAYRPVPRVQAFHMAAFLAV